MLRAAAVDLAIALGLVLVAAVLAGLEAVLRCRLIHRANLRRRGGRP